MQRALVSERRHKFSVRKQVQPGKNRKGFNGGGGKWRGRNLQFKGSTFGTVTIRIERGYVELARIKVCTCGVPEVARADRKEFRCPVFADRAKLRMKSTSLPTSFSPVATSILFDVLGIGDV